jgi:tRNA threonylcarbamoyladenosine biosynthesis protein TsaE
MVFLTESELDTQAAGFALAGRLRRGAVVSVTGDLGAGKTVFARGVARGLGVDASRVTSPTFAIVNEYMGDIPMFHFDMYRLSGADELVNIGWDDYLDRSGVIVAEWGDIAPEVFPEDTIRVVIENLGGNSRRVTIDLPHAEGGAE